MIVFLVRGSDSWEHEGHDSVEDVFQFRVEAEVKMREWNASTARLNRYSFYVEEWEVK